MLATALGGCAESVGNEPASPLTNRPVIAFSRFAPPQPTVDTIQVVKPESLATRSEAKRITRTALTAVGR